MFRNSMGIILMDYYLDLGAHFEVDKLERLNKVGNLLISVWQIILWLFQIEDM